MERTASWTRLVLGNLLVFLTLTLIVGGVGELYYRFVYDGTDSFALTLASERWFRRHYSNNAVGVRDDIEYPDARQPGKRRITFLGDSFTAGHGVADVSDRFANRIRRSRAGDWEVHALAANGLDTGKELRSLAGFVERGYELDVLVLVYVLNDISDIVPEWGEILRRIHGEKRAEPFPVRHSYLLNTLYYRIKAGRDPDLASYYGFVREAYDGELWPIQQSRLASLHEFCVARGVPLLVVTFPFLHDLGPDYAYDDVHRQLDALWRAQRVPHLDLLELYRRHRPADIVVGRQDAHPNVFAHELAAAAIERFIDAQLSAMN